MRIKILEKKIESTSQTLIDFITIMECNDITMERVSKLQNHLRPKVNLLRERVDQLTIELGQLRDNPHHNESCNNKAPIGGAI